MSQSGYTPIQLYRTTTAAATPTAGNLAAGELAINLTDEKLFFKNAAGVVKLLASTDTLGTVTSVAVSGGTTGLTTSGGPITSSGAITLAGTLGVTNGGTGTATAFTAGSVVFAGASGVYSQDNANLFWDNANDRLGVGTSSPAAKLDVNGTVKFSGALTSGDLADAVGYKGVPQNAQTSTYTLALSDMGKHISITTGGVFIPANASVAFPIGSTIVIFNNSASSQTISTVTDMLRLAGTANTGPRTLAQYGLATCVKVAATTWVISGAGVT